VLAPEAVKFAGDNTHTVADGGVIESIGKLKVPTATVRVPMQPKPLVPLTVYIDAEAGVYVVIALVALLLQVYVTAPLAVNEATELAHTVPADCVTNTSGVGLETTVSKVLVEQPKPLVPVSVYVVVIVGDNAAVEEVAPLLQL